MAAITLEELREKCNSAKIQEKEIDVEGVPPVVISHVFPNSRCSQEKEKSQGEFLDSLRSKSQIRTMRAIAL